MARHLPRPAMTRPASTIIYRWNLPERRAASHVSSVTRNWGIRCSFDVSGARLLSNDWSDVLRLWETSSGKQLFSLPLAGYDLLQISPDDRLVAMPVADATASSCCTAWK